MTQTNCCNYAPNFDEVDGAYWFRVVRASVRPPVCACMLACVRLSKPCMLGFWNFIYGFLVEKNLTHVFFLVRFISLSGVMPLWIKSEWNLMHAISYEPCLLGFWNFIYGFLVEKLLTCIFFLAWVTSLSGVMPLRKNQNEILSARYLEKYLS